MVVLLALVALAEPTFRTSAGTLQALDAKPGWGALTWGSPRPADCAVIETHDEDVTCRSTQTRIVDMPAEVGLGFWRDRLWSVTVMVDPDEAGKLLGGLVAAYGAPFQGNALLERRYWGGTDRAVSVLYDWRLPSDPASAVYLYAPIMNEREEALDEASKARAGGL